MKAYVIKLLCLLFAVTLVAGCAGTDTKPEGEGAVVGEGGAGGPGGTGGPGGYGGPGGEGSAYTQGAGGRGSWAGSPLDDPNSPLHTRVVYFEFDSSDIKQEYLPVLRAHAEYLAANPDAKVSLQGHTDERGTREYNLALGERRALSVRRFLATQGANEGQLEYVSYGEESPADTGHDDASWALNRRVELVY